MFPAMGRLIIGQKTPMNRRTAPASPSHWTNAALSMSAEMATRTAGRDGALSDGGRVTVASQLGQRTCSDCRGLVSWNLRPHDGHAMSLAIASPRGGRTFFGKGYLRDFR